jgi:hypothetical protein
MRHQTSLQEPPRLISNFDGNVPHLRSFGFHLAKSAAFGSKDH